MNPGQTEINSAEFFGFDPDEDAWKRVVAASEGAQPGADFTNGDPLDTPVSEMGSRVVSSTEQEASRRVPIDPPKAGEFPHDAWLHNQ